MYDDYEEYLHHLDYLSEQADIAWEIQQEECAAEELGILPQSV